MYRAEGGRRERPPDPGRTRATTDVVIVGAGPTGLVAAARLAEFGIAPVVLDSASTPTQTSKATLVHASTVEILAELGVGRELVEGGRKAHRMVMAESGQPGAAGRLDEAARHYTAQQLVALVLTVAGANLWNRLNLVTRQVAGQEW